MQSSTGSDDLRRIRDLISHPPLQRVLMADIESWLRLCAALDGITDAADLRGRIASLDAVRRELAMEPVGATDPPALAAGIAAVRAELEDRVNSHYAAFADDLLTTHLDPTVAYALEKAAEAVGAIASREQGDSAVLTWNSAGLDSLVRRLTAVDDGLQARGYKDDVRYEVRRALYVCRRAQQLVDGEPDAPDADDADVLVTVALPVLVEHARALASEVDEEYASRHGGWGSSARSAS